ncbi:uncharacterized protein [Capricornis sumatraensis]|uniref:uncharacterized protein isoform X2 n=1 Tax=Capricornis sumatraensis TaxID=34865 RepID=UPI0036044AB4
MFFPNRLVDHVPLAPLTCLTLLAYSPAALRTTPVRRALGVPVGKGLLATINSWEPHNSLSGPRAGLHLLGEQRLSSGLQMRASEVSDMCKKAFPLRVTQVSSGSPVAKAQAPLNPAGHLPLASSGAPAAPDRERLDGGGGGAALEQHVFRRVTRRLAPASSRDAAAWIGPKPSSGILRGPGPRTRHPSTL